MPDLVLGSTTVISESSGTVTFPTGTFNGKPGTDQIVQHKLSRVYSPYHHHYSSSGGWTDHGANDKLKFNFTPLYDTNSYFCLEYYYGQVHTSTSGGRGNIAFTKDGSRTAWEGGHYGDSYGHGSVGFISYPGMYHPGLVRFYCTNSSTTTFEIGVQIDWVGGNWYYGHVGNQYQLSITEYTGTFSVNTVDDA